MWGGSFLMIKKSLVVFPPEQAVFVRMSFASLAYLPFALVYFRKIDWSKWRALLVVSLCGSGLPNYFFAMAQTKVSSSLAGILNSLTPFFALILGVWFFKNKASDNKWKGVLLGLAGTMALILFGRGGGVQFSGEGLLPLFCVAATICYAINANTVANFLQGVHPIAIGSASFFLTAIPYFSGLYFSGAWQTMWTHPAPQTALLCLGYLAVVGTALASMLYFYLVQRAGAIFATSVTYLLPIFAMIFGFFDGEKLMPVHFLGTAAILAGLYLTRKK